VKASRSRVYAGREGRSYSHHQIICKFRDRYVVSWSNGLIHEDHPGQHVRYSWSRDLRSWEPDRVLVATDPASNIVRSNAGMYATDDRLYAYYGVCESLGNANISTGTMVSKRMWLEVQETDDLVRWKGPERLVDEVYLFESPRLTRDGDFLCSAIDTRDWSRMKVLLWPKGSDPGAPPRESLVPPSPDGIMPEQGTWYQADDGELWMYLRDGSYSMRLGLTRSCDGGRSWSIPIRTDFLNSYSRAHAGRLGRGAFYIVGNNYDHFLDRSHLMIALSNDGKLFDRQYVIRNEPTTRRYDGRHKENGYHYPNSIVDGDRLIIVYSVNKEDIEVSAVDIGALR